MIMLFLITKTYTEHEVGSEAYEKMSEEASKREEKLKVLSLSLRKKLYALQT